MTAVLSAGYRRPSPSIAPTLPMLLVRSPLSMTIDKFEGPSVYFFRKIIGLMGTARPWTVPAWLFWPGHVTLAQRASTAQHGLRSGHGTTSTSEQKAKTTVHKSQ
uniref:Uncharacterized protein n=1 Tax=Oryza glumipatula TaxID=40148 RepID=A0A0D9ZNH0_9ORYZ